MNYFTRYSTIRHHAAYWITRLHSENCTDAEKEAFQKWLADSQDHATEFQHLTEIWELGAGAPQTMLPTIPVARKNNILLNRRTALACLGTSVLMLSPLGQKVQATQLLQTKTGDISTFTLGGKICCQMDTDTKLAFIPDSQCCRLEKGQVILSASAAASTLWVIAAHTSVYLQLHASTNIRIAPDCVHVTALQDKILVRSEHLPASGAWLQPGQRLRFFADGHLHSDYPEIDTLLSWQEGRLIFRNRPLWEVITEINRYIPQKIKLDAPLLINRPLSGVYYIARGNAFLQMLVRLLPIRLVNNTNGITLLPA